MGTLALQLMGATKSYYHRGRELPVLRGVDLDVRENEVLVVLGPSGCGKSTLLRVLAGLEPLTGGQRVVNGPARGDGRIGLVFQEPLLLPWLTVRQNIAVGLRYRANRGRCDPAEVDRILAEFALEELADRYPGELSGGQAQRVSLARTLVTRPRVLLLDEPFSALDPPTRAALQRWLLELKARHGLTVVLVTHDVEDAVFMGDRIALLSRRPATIRRIWDVPPNGCDGQASERRRRLAEEILAHYDPAAIQTHPAAVGSEGGGTDETSEPFAVSAGPRPAGAGDPGRPAAGGAAGLG